MVVYVALPPTKARSSRPLQYAQGILPLLKGGSAMLGFSQKYCLLLLHITASCYSPCDDRMRLNYGLTKGTGWNLEIMLKKARGRFQGKSCLMIVEHFKPIFSLKLLYQQATVLIRISSEILKATQ